MEIELQHADDGLFAELAGRFTLPADTRCLDLLEEEVSRRRADKLVLDLGRVESIDCAGIGRLVLLYRRCRKAGTALQVTNVDPRILRLLELTQVAGMLRACGAADPRRRVRCAMLAATIATTSALAAPASPQQQVRRGQPTSPATVSHDHFALPILSLIMPGMDGVTDAAAQVMQDEILRILVAAGVSARHVSFDEANRSNRPGCNLVMSVVVRNSDPRAWDLPPETMGVAIPRMPPRNVYLFYPPIERTLNLPRRTSASAADVYIGRALAYIVVHELVHAFAPEYGHDRWGLMGYEQSAESLVQAGIELHKRAAAALRAGWEEAKGSC